MKKIILLIIGIFLFQLLYSQCDSIINWNADLDFLAKELPQKHYNFFTIKTSNEFQKGIEAIKQESKNLTDTNIALKIQKLIASFGDSHTRLNFMPFIDRNQILPLQLYWFSDGLFILATTPENSEILGYKILSINGFDIKTVIDSLSTLISVDNQSILKNTIPQFLPLIQILEHFGFVKEQKVELGLMDSIGKCRLYEIQPAVMNRNNKQRYKTNSIALCYKNENILFTDVYLPENKIYYLQYNKCWSKELALKYGNKKDAANLPSFKAFETRIFQTLKKKSVEKIIFDMRFNGGGSSLQGTLFIKKLATYLKKYPAIKTYVVIGRATFSSAILNTMDFKSLTNSVFVGEETGGKPNHFGEVRGFQLPSSGSDVFYSTKYFKQSDEDVNTIKPDVKLESSFSDFSKGIDPVYEWIKIE